jgi:NitT/TauT family transport system substrate-binding protein
MKIFPGRTLVFIAAGLAVLGGLSYWFWATPSHPLGQNPGPLEKITLGVDSSGLNALIWIAHQKFDAANGLEMVLKTYPSGRDALRDLEASRLDFACCAAFVLVKEILAGQTNLRCLSALASGEICEVIARRDRGISRPEDLRGKTIGVPRGTSAEFFLGRFLTFNHIALTEVRIIDINPLDLADNLAAGKVDAVLIWEPITYEIVKKIGGNAVSWPAQVGQDVYWLLAGQEGYLKSKPMVAEKLLRVLSQAADFMKHRPEEGWRIIAEKMQVPLSELQAGRYPKKFELFLEQSLVLAMEGEARWLIRNRLTDRDKLPNFLDYFDAEALAQVAPEAMRLIIPKAEGAMAPAPAGAKEGR